MIPPSSPHAIPNINTIPTTVTPNNRPTNNSTTTTRILHPIVPHVITPNRPINRRPRDLKGVKEAPLWEIDPSRCITPLLHLEIGLFSKAWKNLELYFDDKVELLPVAEQNLKRDLRMKKDKSITLKVEIDRLKTQKVITHIKRNDHILEEEGIASVLQSRPPMDIMQIRELKERRKVLKTQIKELWEDIKIISSKMKELDMERIANNKDTVKPKKRLAHLRKIWLGHMHGLDADIDSMLKVEANIYRESYHGGDLNGVCVRRFLEQSTYLMGRIKAMACERRNVNIGREGYDNRCSNEELKKMLDTYSKLFQVMDLLFSLFRIPGPTVYDIRNAKKTVESLEQLWNELGISVTPKAHIIFKHTVHQYEFFGGIADKLEDFVEKSHQTGKRLEYTTSRLPSGDYKRKQMIHFQRMWMLQDPDVLKQTSDIHTLSKRKINHPLVTSLTRKRQCRLLLRTKTKEEIVNQSHFEEI
jgi:hypothetical protein